MLHGWSQRSSFPGKFHIYLDRVVLMTVLQGIWGLGGKVTGESWTLIPLKFSILDVGGLMGLPDFSRITLTLPVGGGRWPLESDH